MTDLALYLSSAVVGYFVARALAKHNLNMGWVGKVQTLAITLLVFTMGMRMGCNEEVISNLNMIGVYALCFTVVTMVCSLVGVTILRRAMGIDKFGYFTRGKGEAKEAVAPEENESQEGGGSSKMSLIIVIMVSLGLLVGYTCVGKVFDDPQVFIDGAGNGIRVGLCILLFLIGFEMGLEGTFVSDFKRAGIKVLAFPITIAICTLIGAVICGLLIQISAKESLAIGAGFGWYSLAPVVILEKGFVMASAISFMHNILRAMSSIVFVPFVAKKIGYMETIALPACTSLDVCLPIITKSTRPGIAIYSFLSGLTLSILVPILVPLFIGL